jgi:Heavy metal binding domain
MTIYVCPLHPDEESTQPTTCSRCGTKLEEREATTRTAAKKLRSEPIRGK